MMLWLPRIMLLSAAAGTLFGCTQFSAYHTKTSTSPPAPITYEVVDCFSGRNKPTMTTCEEEVAGSYAIQHRHYRYQDRGHVARTGEYHMAFVEFDDQGWFADRRQMEALFMLLRTLEENDRHTLILVYAHGWKHNASGCDNNVHCFSRLVERMDILERHLDEAKAMQPGAVEQKGPGRVPRHVVAVYVGWRGLSLKGALANISFWTRKATAERVGRGGVKELLTRLNDYRRVRNPSRDEAKTQLAIAGHSFGGLVVYSALSHSLIERASSVHRTSTGTVCNGSAESGPGGLTCYDIATSFGDLIVLVNPAFEGSLYEPLFHVATNRCYSARQRPVLVTVTSAGDSATGRAFPFGRYINSLFEHAGSGSQRDSILQTVGHDKRYETHRLEWRDEPAGKTPQQAEPEVRVPEERDCGCPYLDVTEDFKWWEFADPAKLPLVPRPTTEAARAASTPPAITPVIDHGRRVYGVYGDRVILSGDMKYSANYPYLVITADPKIIADHNAIYNEPFIEFLHKFFLLHVANSRPFEADVCHRNAPGCQAGGALPCERSCELPDGGAACTLQE